MTDAAPRKFAFDTVFDDAGVVSTPARPKRLYPADEVDGVAAAAREEGRREAMASVEAQQAQALATIAQACAQALPRLTEVAHEHREGSAELALACARAMAGAALDRFPEAPLRAALEALAREIDTAPRLVLAAAPEGAEALGRLVEESLQAAGFPGQVTVRPDPALPRAAFSLDFGDGSAAFEPDQAAERVAATLRQALAAEGLHAEPLLPGYESRPDEG